ncbi:MAG: ComEC/Rec2 family competence protein [Candidatus Paceibacterota bacterium]
MQDRIFYLSCFGFASGVLLRSLLVLNIFYVLLLLLIFTALLLFFIFISRNNIGIIFSVFILLFCLGVLRFNSVNKSYPASFENTLGESFSLGGEIVDEPDIRENNQKLTIETKKEVNKTKILVTLGLGQEFKYGDEISFSGKLKKPENFITDQGKEFDYINYLRKDGIFYVMNYPKIEVISSGNGNKLKSFLFATKDKFLKKINFAIASPENLLMSGLILGEKSQFDQALRQTFVDTGTIHIVALSGYNVTIVAEWIMKFFNLITFVPKNVGIGAGILAIILFVIMSGGSSTAIRAGIMATLALIARATGRNYAVGRALVLAGVAMILFNPFILVYDVSFQLSFLATIAVIFLSPRIEKHFSWVTKRFGLRDIISVTCAAYIFVLPFILYKMGNLSIVALPANILILPFIPLTMLLGFATGLVGFISNFISVPIGYVAYAFLHYELGVISFFSHFPFAAYTIPDFPLLLTILIYTVFFYLLFGKSAQVLFKKGVIEKESDVYLIEQI